MKRHSLGLKRVESVPHPHVPTAVHEMHERHAGHWISDFPWETALVFACVIALMVFCIMLLIDVNMKLGITPLFGG